MIDVKQFVTNEERPGRDFPTFAVRPKQMYPAMIAHIKETLADAKLAPTRVLDLAGTPNPLVMYHDEAKSLRADAFDLALVPAAQAATLSVEQRLARNAALECARKWFTELLHQSNGGKPMGVHILAEDLSFKLC